MSCHKFKMSKFNEAFVFCFFFSFSEAWLFLSSLYISESWSGVTTAELFMSHVSLVARAKCKRQKAPKSAQTQTAIRAICNDIISKKNKTSKH